MIFLIYSLHHMLRRSNLFLLDRNNKNHIYDEITTNEFLTRQRKSFFLILLAQETSHFSALFHSSLFDQILCTLHIFSRLKSSKLNLTIVNVLIKKLYRNLGSMKQILEMLEEVIRHNLISPLGRVKCVPENELIGITAS